MKLARLDLNGQEVVATVADGVATPVSTGGQSALIDIAMSRQAPPAIGAAVPLANAKILAPIGRPGAFRDCMAFEQHARDSNRERQVRDGWRAHPYFYFTNPNAVRNPGDEIRIPRDTRCLDFELEVACVIGREAADLDPDDPATLAVIAGFTIMNDWSARDVQTTEMKQNMGPIKGKDFATSLGPLLVTPDEFADFASGRPRARMEARVNGALYSQGDLSTIYFAWGDILAFASQDTRLLPGDVIGSGTVGSGCIIELRNTGQRDTRPWLQAGDVVELEVEGIGMLRNTVVGR